MIIAGVAITYYGLGETTYGYGLVVMALAALTAVEAYRSNHGARKAVRPSPEPGQAGVIYRPVGELSDLFTIKELHRYSATVRRAFLEKLAGLPWETVTKNREASFYSMKDIMLHMIDNEDMVLSREVLKSPDYKKPRDWAEYTDMRMIIQLSDEVQKRTDAYLDKAEERELARRVNFNVRSGSFDLAAEECLMQSFTEQLYHMGELIALMWQEDIEPPKMQWFFNNPRARPPGVLEGFAGERDIHSVR